MIEAIYIAILLLGAVQAAALLGIFVYLAKIEENFGIFVGLVIGIKNNIQFTNLSSMAETDFTFPGTESFGEN